MSRAYPLSVFVWAGFSDVLQAQWFGQFGQCGNQCVRLGDDPHRHVLDGERVDRLLVLGVSLGMADADAEQEPAGVGRLDALE